MPDLLICAGPANLNDDRMDIPLKLVIAGVDQLSESISFPLSELGTNAAQFNNDIIDKVKVLLSEKYGITIAGGDKVNLLGGIDS